MKKTESKESKTTTKKTTTKKVESAKKAAPAKKASTKKPATAAKKVEPAKKIAKLFYCVFIMVYGCRSISFSFLIGDKPACRLRESNIFFGCFSCKTLFHFISPLHDFLKIRVTRFRVFSAIHDFSYIKKRTL